MARHERSAGFVIYRPTLAGSHEYLLLDYGRHWDFPKGHVEKGEDELTAATRELKEETGITDARVFPGFKQEIGYFFRDRKKGLINKKVVFFLAQTETGPDDIVLSHEHEGFEFLPFDTAIRRTSFPTARRILKLAEEAITGKPVEPDSDTLSPKRAKHST
ncbi:MAG TPA: NUDIX domain-containing protein [Tepidisphaeraceae bacterium]|nr:NUDIX domain-containing protein [Tepidisphaeraceae bacterium]